VTSPSREACAGDTDTRFPKGERLRDDREYRDVVRRGERVGTLHFTVYRDFRSEGRRIGISAGKRVGGAVIRNRIKRVLREFCRLHKDAFPPGSRTAIVVRKAPAGAGLASVAAELLPAIQSRWGKKKDGPLCRQETSP
jgi:ribonuclease P protein component